MGLYLAYDGSINANWIARYALRMAANHADKRLTVVYVEDASTLAADLEAGLERLQLEASWLGVAAAIDICPMRHGVLGGLIVKVGSRMIDSSLRTKLQRLRLAMTGVG